MTVIRTDKWLLDLYDNPINLCKKLKAQFFGVQAYEIHNHLAMYGMYRHPVRNGKDLIKKLQKNNVWGIVREEKKHLEREWDGPNIPVFIFPSDPHNRRIQRELGGKSGLAFGDKLFLFISEDTDETELRALFTHEYNHVCRLSKYQKKENDYTLVDTIVLEGMAENAVHERFGEESAAPWTRYYSDKDLEEISNNLVIPNRNIRKNDNKHQTVLYGLRGYPRMAGYCCGHYLVKKYMEANSMTTKDLLNIDAETIAQIHDDESDDEE
ncbi:DUF2268 domain-containing protein [Virgibacillus doumboii]|uniref:DUF2268 domain-containing protein n=1 Tax=Virgibacillus doumboii TaxID=2697503 RepID=UPI0013DF982C|nr:DUF2268 domain-containing protein [Virgibacillus doumboii]